MSKKQTAVEWIRQEWLKRDIDISIKELFIQAKAMEKEQMKEFAQEVFRNRYNQITQSLDNIADEIYNETYGE
jgi:hypothetical protein